MNTIDSTSRFLTQIAEQVSGLARQLPAIDKKSNHVVAEKRPIRTSLDVNNLVAQRVLAIAPDDPHRRRKAFRIFLESILVNELGDELINDPAFHTLVDNVQQTMERNQDLLAAIDTAGEFLLGLAAGKKK
jgi:hypothetical protein